MSFPRLLGLIAAILFTIIALIALVKGCRSVVRKSYATQKIAPVELSLAQEVRVIPQVVTPPPPAPKVAKAPKKSPEKVVVKKKPIEKKVAEVDRVAELFNVDGPKLPIVETITYKSRVSWQKGRPAWLADYARHYETSRHFIARSMHGKPDYFKQDLVENVRFNVYRKDKDIQFYLLVDLSKSKMWLFYDDLDAKQRVLLKTYLVGLGRVDGSRVSGFLTPVGKYTLGNKVAIYKPKMMGHHGGEPVEMITVFGTRWIPFDKEVSGCSASAKGLGVHGLPWVHKGENKELVQDRSSLGKYQSDGCVRMASEDMEELFAIIVTKPTTIDIVKTVQTMPQASSPLQ